MKKEEESGRGGGLGGGGGGPTCAILVHLHWSIVHLGHSLHLNVVSMTVVFPFPVNVGGEVLCHVVGEVIGILHLQERKSKKKPLIK